MGYVRIGVNSDGTYKYKIHNTAVVETTDIGDGTTIGPFTYISKRVVIGNDCNIFGASIGLPGEHPHSVEDNLGNVIIGNNVEIREFVTINAPLFGEKTVVGDNSYLMAKSHVGHDATLGNNVILHTGAIIGGHSIIGNFCYMGLNSSTHPKAVLTDFCIVGASSFFKGKSVEAVTWAGVPAKPIKVNKVGIERHAKESGLSDFELNNLLKTAEVFVACGGIK